jgi:5-formyltetrahydrofolate cyclo-ligase
VDIVFVPGLAFDRKGLRLGRGKGYYDRFLASLDGSSPRPVRCGIAFAEQFVEEVPIESHDRPVDVLFTPLEKMVFESP